MQAGTVSEIKECPPGMGRYSHVPKLMGDGEGCTQPILFTNGAAP